jgi:hypothetical protein
MVSVDDNVSMSVTYFLDKAIFGVCCNLMDYVSDGMVGIQDLGALDAFLLDQPLHMLFD